MAESTSFVFAGGGSLGAIQVGMLHELLLAGVRADFVVGSSVGAVNAACFAAAPDLACVERLEALWTGLTRRDVFPFTIASAFRLLRRGENLIDPSRLRHLLQTHLAIARLEQARIGLHVMATDQQGIGVRLSSGSAVESVLASAAVPGIFPPVRIGGQDLMDGAIAANTPLRLAVQLGAQRIVVLPTGYACALESAPRGAIAKVLHAVTLLIAWQLMHELDTVPPDVQVHLAPALCPLAVSPYDFSASRQLIERARRSTRLWIAEGGLERPARSRELSPHHHRN